MNNFNSVLKIWENKSIMIIANA